MGKRDILEEALKDSKTLRAAAISNAKIALMDSIKDSVAEAVEKQLNEEMEAHDEPDGDECAPDDSGNVNENLDLDADADADDLDIDEEGGEDEGEEDMGSEHEGHEGLDSDDLSEAIAEALEVINEVENPSMGDSEMVDHARPSGGFDDDMESKEMNWDEETAPHAKNQHQLQGVKSESKILRKKLTEVTKENIILRRANKKLREAVDEIKLFNAKIVLANKLISKEGLSASTKRKIVEKIDSAKSIVEAKSVYEAFDCALSSLSESAKPKAKKAPALTEVLGSAGANKPVNKESLKESLYGAAFSKERFQQLAGISSDEE